MKTTKMYYTIGEVAKELGVNTSLIRFWEKEFDNLNPKKSSNGKRKFTCDDIDQLHIIYRLLKKEGYTIEGAKLKINEIEKQEKKIASAIDRLENIKSQLIEIKNQIS